ncbi:MAG: zinc-dependent metalloprotease [Ilumatobacteraceae bacterium]
MADGDSNVPDPFASLPMFAEMAKALAGQGPLNWEAARQFAVMAANGGAGEPNVDPMARMRLAELARIVEMHVADVAGADPAFPEITAVTRSAWALRSLDDYRPLFTDMAASLSQSAADTPAEGDPMAAMMAGISRMMGPSMMGMAIGSMIGRLAARTFGCYDLPIPRPSTDILVVPDNVETFAQAWEIDADEMRLWVIAQELTAHSLFSAVAFRNAVSDLFRRHVGAFRPDPTAIMDHLAAASDADMGDPMSAMQRLLSDPALLLGAVQSPDQAALAPALDAAAAGVVGYVDYLVDTVAVRVIGGNSLRIADAVRRRRVGATPDDLFVERLLGLRLTIDHVQRGKDFVAGVVDRVGERRLTELFRRGDALPTPAELEAPGLWVARLEL